VSRLFRTRDDPIWVVLLWWPPDSTSD
jgi:hypothetical protein